MQHMDGRRALVYSRIRGNRLDPCETDFDRAQRQQQVMQATRDKVTCVGAPSASVHRRRPRQAARDRPQRRQVCSSVGPTSAPTRDARCIADSGVSPRRAGGQSVIFGSEDNVGTIAMFTGRSAPLLRRGPPVRARDAPVGDRRRESRVRRLRPSCRGAGPRPSSRWCRCRPSRPPTGLTVLRRLARSATVVGRVEARSP